MKPILLSLLLATALCPQTRVIVSPFPPGSGLEYIPTPSSGPGSGTVTSVTIGAGAGISLSGTCTITTSGTCTVSSPKQLTFSIGAPGSGVALTTSSRSGTLPVAFACTIGNPSGSSYSIVLGAGDSGTVTVTFWKIAAGTAIPTVANVINTSGISLATGSAVDSSTFSDFTTKTVAAKDKMIMAITAITGTIDNIVVTLPCD